MSGRKRVLSDMTFAVLAFLMVCHMLQDHFAFFLGAFCPTMGHLLPCQGPADECTSFRMQPVLAHCQPRILQNFMCLCSDTSSESSQGYLACQLQLSRTNPMKQPRWDQNKERILLPHMRQMQPTPDTHDTPWVVSCYCS